MHRRDRGKTRREGSASLEFVPSLGDWKADGIASAVTIGMFDGLHLGHQSLLRTLTDRACEEGLRTVVLTFDSNPRLAMAGRRGEKHITGLEEKRALLESKGIDLCAIIPVAGSILTLDAREFVEQFLVGRLAARLVVVGYDFQFGRNRTGDFHLLEEMGKERGYRAVQSKPVVVGGRPIKSTRIRESIRKGEIQEAGELLGRPYAIGGPVVHGDQIGRQLGFPTVNVSYAATKLLPAPGVYGGFCVVDGRRWLAAINLGIRPTVGSRNAGAGDHPPETEDRLGRWHSRPERPAPLLEAHLIGFTGDLYGRHASLEFMERIRGEERFSGLEALKQQILRDVQRVSARTSSWNLNLVDGWSWPDDPSHVAPA